MRGLVALTAANLRSFTRDRAALFWTFFFPVIFVILFGTIFAGGSSDYSLGWVDEDGTPPAALLREAFVANAPVEIADGTLEESRERMSSGDLDGILVIPKGLAEAIEAAQDGGGGAPV